MKVERGKSSRAAGEAATSFLQSKSDEKLYHVMESPGGVEQDKRGGAGGVTTLVSLAIPLVSLATPTLGWE